MPSHVETPCTGAAGIKLFGKVITAQQQPMHRAGGNAAAALPRLPPQASRRGSVDMLEEAARARAAAAEARLPCPRCRSRDTKFCYFNNYNVNQPRHFCRACHRYWTAGGALRNVPVGSGRRKNRATATTSDERSGSASPPLFSAPPAGFFPSYHDSSSHFTASAACDADGLPETTEQWRWLVTSTAKRSVASDHAF